MPHRQGMPALPPKPKVSRSRWRVFALLAATGVVAGIWVARAPSGERVADETALRTQEPARPLPYLEQEVAIPQAGAGITLAGTFTLPTGKAPFPAVLLIPGSGPQDRDSTQFGHRPFLVLADLLTRQGIAVLRVDRREAGKSTGSFAAATQEDFAADARAALEFLRRRSGVDARRVGLLGHSEGGLIALRTVALAADVAFVVLLASPGLPHADVVAGQHRAAARAGGIDGALIERWIGVHRAYLQIVTTASDPVIADAEIRKLWAEQVLVLSAQERTALGIGEGALEQMLEQAKHPGFVSAARADPRALLANVTCPVLALNGGKDVQVLAADNLPAIRSALAAARNTRTTSVTLPMLNHLFQTARTGLVSEYATISETFDPRAAKLIADWIVQQDAVGR